MRYKKIPTSSEVFAVLWARHQKDFTVFGTISHPSGNPHGNRYDCQMYTEWGFKEADAPLVAIDETWENEWDGTAKQDTRAYKYYLFAVIEENES